TPFFYVADTSLGLLSIFDDLKYDRSDADIMSPPMRKHAAQQLTGIGFKQEAGTKFFYASEDTRCVIPKNHALGGSPFDATRYTPKREQDFFLLTPTQTACAIIDGYDVGQAYERLTELIKRQPINLYRIADYMERKPDHEAFRPRLGDLKTVQRIAVETEPLRTRRALR
ncbi:MAG: hypothetical protein AAGG69_02840, partial [Pseudomonadota bacterium]